MKRILVLAQDAGSGEILSSLVRHEQTSADWSILAPEDSPAHRIFRRKGLGGILRTLRAEDAPSACLDAFTPDYLFRSTGWHDIPREIAFLREARARGIPSASFLDHWVFYRERFGYPAPDWQKDLSDLVVVGDERARRLAVDCGLPGVVRLKNRHFADLLEGYAAAEARRTTPPDRLLIISEPITEYAAKRIGPSFERGYTEYAAMRDILASFSAHASRWGVRNPVIRLHPADTPGKYDALLREFAELSPSLESPSETDLIDSLAAARMVIGFESMPLVLAHLIGKPLLSYVPTKKPRVLPLPEGCCVGSASDFSSVDFTRVRPAGEDLLFGDDCDLASLIRCIETRRIPS